MSLTHTHCRRLQPSAGLIPSPMTGGAAAGAWWCRALVAQRDRRTPVDSKAYAAHAPQPRGNSGTVLAALQVVCAWCQQHIVWHRVPPPRPFPMSYS
jgi:hypothetical protein